MPYCSGLLCLATHETCLAIAASSRKLSSVENRVPSSFSEYSLCRPLWQRWQIMIPEFSSSRE